MAEHDASGGNGGGNGSGSSLAASPAALPSLPSDLACPRPAPRAPPPQSLGRDGSLTGGLTVVVSPLVSLMADQLASLPPSLRLCAATLSGSMSAVDTANVLRDLRERRLRLLFVSPERLLSASFRLMAQVLYCRCRCRPLTDGPSFRLMAQARPSLLH